MSKRIIFLFAVFTLWILVFAVQKPLFLFYHHALAGGLNWGDYIQVVLHGLLLDCTVSGYLTAVPLLFVLVSIWFPGSFYKKIVRWYFAVMAVAVASVFSLDLALYGFWRFRLDATLFFYLQSPANAIASVPVGMLLIHSLVFVLYAYVIYWLFVSLVVPLFTEAPVKRRLGGTGITFLLAGILFVVIRGGITTSTANVGMVYFSQNQFLNHSAINPCFSLLASLTKQQDFAAQFNYFSEEQRAAIMEGMRPDKDSLSVRPERMKLLKTDRPSVLIVLLESFSANTIEAVGGTQGVTPNINKLSKEGILFTNMYANSFRTDRGIVSVLNGYPAQPTTSIMKYPAKSQTLPSIAKSLDKVGYTADMLYGGDINFTNMRGYFFGSGYSKITADGDFPLSSRLSKWGANDDVTFHHLYTDIKDRKVNDKPWLTTFLTLSSHEPFEVPFHRLDDPYLNSVAFTDSCLGDFIGKLKELPVWNDLLVVLVADHGFHYPADLTDYEPRRFHIPMLWLGGVVKKPAVIDAYSCQTDLAATLLGQMNLPYEEFRFSKDIFNSSYPQFAFYTYPNLFGFIDSTGVSVFDNEGKKALIEEPIAGGELRMEKGKALLQTLYDDLDSR